MLLEKIRLEEIHMEEIHLKEVHMEGIQMKEIHLEVFRRGCRMNEEDHFQIETRSFSLIDEYYPLILGPWDNRANRHRAWHDHLVGALVKSK